MAISPFTEKNTKIVCINAGDRFNYTKSCKPLVGTLDGLTEGVVYTVAEIIEDPGLTGGFAVVLAEITRAQHKDMTPTYGFALQRFNYVDLPKCLTELLVSAPIKTGKQKVEEDA